MVGILDYNWAVARCRGLALFIQPNSWVPLRSTPGFRLPPAPEPVGKKCFESFSVQPQCPLCLSGECFGK